MGHDGGAVLAAELGYTPFYLHDNTGLSIADAKLCRLAQPVNFLRNLPDTSPCGRRLL